MKVNMLCFEVQFELLIAKFVFCNYELAYVQQIQNNI